jgi:bcr-type benzoyl-CoA reductase subunit B
MTAKRYKRLQTSAELQRLMQWHYASVRHLRWGRPVAWITSGAPVEILRAMGVAVVYPENYTALCAARQECVPMCEVAEAQGYSPDLCSYARTHIGSVLEQTKAPLGGLPRPDLLVCCNNICGTVVKWYEALALDLSVPLFVLDTPFVHDKASGSMLQYVRDQIRELVHWLEQTTGRDLDYRRLREAVALSDEAVGHWAAIRALCKARPSPLNAPDLFVCMAPIVVLRGTRHAVRYYAHLRQEVEQRVQKGIGAIPEERFRLVWDNIAIWHHLYRFYGYFVDYGACFVVDSYTGGWDLRIPEGDPLDSLAATYASVFLNQSLQRRVDLIVGLIQEYNADGFVMHSNRSCKPYSLGQYAIRRAVMERTGAPSLVIEADMCDPRIFAAEPAKTRIQAFVESLEEA